MNFHDLLTETKPKKLVVSFDFDGTLHHDVDGWGNPLDYWDSDPTPFEDTINTLHEEAKKAEIVIVSARPPDAESTIREFITRHGLPVEQIYLTNLRPKVEILSKIGAIRHYDDRDMLLGDLEGAGIELVKVRPDASKSKNMQFDQTRLA